MGRASARGDDGSSASHAGCARVASLVLLVQSCAAGCSSGSASVSGPVQPRGSSIAARPAPPAPPRDPLVVGYDAALFRARPKLLEKIRSSPHAYFRFIDVPFEDQVCRRFAMSVGDAVVNLHGDAHLEQYAVSASDRGLADFDAATTGPAALDLMRFMVSLRLAARQRGWSDGAPQLLAAFIAGYRAALKNPGAEPAEPSIVKKVRSRFDRTPEQWLDRMEGLMRPVDPARAGVIKKASEEYFTAMREQNPDLQPWFFDVKHWGAMDVGIGSAFEEKYLSRVEGPTKAPGDDILLEAKQVSNLEGVSCIQGPRGPDPFRIIIGQSRLGSGDQRLLGYFVAADKAFYVQSWRVHYTELRIEDFASIDELTSVAEDAGQQLGRGHPKLIAAPRDAQLRRALARALDREERNYHEAAADLEQKVVSAWMEFKHRSE